LELELPKKKKSPLNKGKKALVTNLDSKNNAVPKKKKDQKGFLSKEGLHQKNETGGRNGGGRRGIGRGGPVRP